MHSRARGVLVGGAMLGVVALQVPAAAADDPTREEARKLAYAGVASYQAADYPAASAKLEKAYAMLPAPSVGLYSARALVKLGKLTDAARRYRQISELAVTPGEPSVQDAARKAAAADLVALTPRIPGLSVHAAGATLEQIEVVLDGAAVSRNELGSELLLDPGTHALQGRRGAQIVNATVQLTEGEHTSTVLTFPEPAESAAQSPTLPVTLRAESTAAPARSSSSLRTAGWIGVAAGGGALALSGVGALIALADKPGGCTDHVCAGSVGGYNTWRNVSTVAFYSGAVLGAAGVTLLLAAPKTDPRAQSLSLTLQAGGARFEGSF